MPEQIRVRVSWITMVRTISKQTMYTKNGPIVFNCPSRRLCYGLHVATGNHHQLWFWGNLWRFGPPKVDHLTNMSGSLTPSVISKGPCAAQGVRSVLDAFEGLEFLPQFRHGFLDFDLHLLPRWQQNMPFPKVIAEKDMGLIPDIPTIYIYI